jgi:radical SAM superfamily enzyme YgiQ (UPF0313 family)
MPPLGLLTIAALIPKQHNVKLIDINVEELKSEDIIWADIVCISAMIVQKESLRAIIKRCNKFKVPAAVGGPYATFSYASIKGVNHFILGEAERTFPKFLKDFEEGRAKIIYYDKEKEMIDMNDENLCPVPRYGLISYENYVSATIQISRGCVFNCEFCNIVEMFGRKIRVKSIFQILNELDLLHSLGWRGGLFIADDNLAAISNIKEILKDIINWQQNRNFPFSFGTQLSINYLKDEELLNLLVEANFDFVFVGIESPSVEVLQSIGKRQNMNISLVDTIKKVQERGIEVIAGLIVGFDTDPEDIFQQQIEFIESAGITRPLIGLLTALPSTRLQRRLISEGRFIKESAGNHTHILDLNFESKMDKERLISSYTNMLTYLYKPRNYFARCFAFLKQAHFSKLSTCKANIKQRALLRVLLTQITSFYWRDYLKFIIKVILCCPYSIKEALYLAIVGHHFILLTDQMKKNPEVAKKNNP